MNDEESSRISICVNQEKEQMRRVVEFRHERMRIAVNIEK